MDNPISRDELTTALRDALKPLLDEMREMRIDIQNLKITTATRGDVYDKAIMDEKLGGLRAEVESINRAVAAMKEFNWKVFGAGISIMVILAGILPHLNWHP